jgi:DNA helicase HerA-like ATPase
MSETRGPKPRALDIPSDSAEDSKAPETPSQNAPQNGSPSDAAQSQKLKVKIEDGIVILGRRGSGKSNIIRYLVKGPLKSYKFVVLDVVGSLKSLEGQPNVEYYVVNPRRTQDVNKIINKVLEERNKMLVSDEIDRFDYMRTSALNDLVNIGRNYGVGYIVAARRTATVSKDFLSNAEFSFVFQHILPQDLEVLREWYNIDEQILRNLKAHEVILFHGAEPIWRGMVPYVP